MASPVAAVRPGGRFYVSSSFTRPADTTAYASGDLVANSTTAGSVTPLSWAAARHDGSILIVRNALILIDDATITNASFRLHLFNASPTVTNGDNGAISFDSVGYAGQIDVVVTQTHAKAPDGATGYGVPTTVEELFAQPATGTRLIYGLLEARAAYTPISGEIFTVTLAGYHE